MKNPNPAAPRPSQPKTIFDRAWDHWYKFSAGMKDQERRMDFVVSFARKEVLRDRKRRKP